MQTRRLGRTGLMVSEIGFGGAPAGLTLEAAGRDMGIVTMRSLTSGTFQRWPRAIDPELERRGDLSHALLSFVLSNPLVGVALVGTRSPAEAEANVAASEDHRYRLDLDALHDRYADRP